MQSWALLVDSYRLVVSRKLFWITLIISAVVVLLYASIGFDDTGWSILFGLSHFDSEFFKAGSVWANGLYLGIFSYFIVGIWLTWAATILALISTAPIFIDFMSDGAIDLALSKPISRTHIFAVKYLGGLLFVVLQVALFSLGVFLCVGWRVGDWNWSIFSAIPLVAIFFSYLFAFNVLMNLWTRSTMASILMTMLFWFGLYAVQTAEQVLNRERIQREVVVDIAEKELQAANSTQDVGKTAGDPLTSRNRSREREVDQARKTGEKLAAWHGRVKALWTVLPKTQETTALLDRWIVTDKRYNLQAIMRGDMRSDDERGGVGRFREVQRRLEDDMRSRTSGFIIGTSLAFEALVLLLAGWIFVRRDF